MWLPSLPPSLPILSTLGSILGCSAAIHRNQSWFIHSEKGYIARISGRQLAEWIEGEPDGPRIQTGHPRSMV